MSTAVPSPTQFNGGGCPVCAYLIRRWSITIPGLYPSTSWFCLTSPRSGQVRGDPQEQPIKACQQIRVACFKAFLGGMSSLDHSIIPWYGGGVSGDKFGLWKAEAARRRAELAFSSATGRQGAWHPKTEHRQEQNVSDQQRTASTHKSKFKQINKIK